jgi:hypothetical protein
MKKETNDRKKKTQRKRNRRTKAEHVKTKSVPCPSAIDIPSLYLRKFLQFVI